MQEAKRVKYPSDEYTYTERDVALYNLGIGATEKDLQWIFEGHENFNAIPTFGVIPQFAASSGMSLDWLPNFSPVSAGRMRDKEGWSRPILSSVLEAHPSCRTLTG